MPIIVMMQEGIRLEAHVDDALAFLAGEAAALKFGTGEGGPIMPVGRRSTGAERRRVRREAVGERE